VLTRAGVAALVVCAAIAGLAYVLRGDSGSPTAPQPDSRQLAMLDAFRAQPGDNELGLLFDELNLRHFGGVLPTVKVIWASDLDRLDIGDYRLNGMTDGRIILLKAALKDDQADVRRTLCHEMVHVKFIAGGNRLTTHDTLFQDELRRIFEDGCFQAIWASAEEKASLKQWIDAERARLDTARLQVEAEGAAIERETDRVERTFTELNERIRAANTDGAGWPSRDETAAAEEQRNSLNARIAAYNSAAVTNKRDQDRFNEAVERYNLMLAYPDGLAEDRAKGLIR
jgi:hypothetical protein